MLYFYRRAYDVFSSYAYIHKIKEMFVYIYTLYSIRCFSCLQDLARLNIALNILAHVPKSLLDPGRDASIEQVCNISNMTFQKFPSRQDNLLTIVQTI